MPVISCRPTIFAFVRFLSISILLLSMMASSFSPCLPILEYALNKPFIVARLCENRNRPEMKCEGKCYLCKRIQKQSKNEAENPEQKSSYRFLELAMGATPSFHFSRIVDSLPSWLPFLTNGLTAFPADVFHPPQA